MSDATSSISWMSGNPCASIPQCKKTIRTIAATALVLVIAGVALSFFSQIPSPLSKVFTALGGAVFGIAAPVCLIQKCKGNSRAWLISLIASSILLAAGITISTALSGHAGAAGGILWNLSLPLVITSGIGYAVSKWWNPNPSTTPRDEPPPPSPAIVQRFPRKQVLINKLTTLGYGTPTTNITENCHITALSKKEAFGNERVVLNASRLFIWIEDLKRSGNATNQCMMTLALDRRAAEYDVVATFYPSRHTQVLTPCKTAWGAFFDNSHDNTFTKVWNSVLARPNIEVVPVVVNTLYELRQSGRLPKIMNEASNS